MRRSSRVALQAGRTALTKLRVRAALPVLAALALAACTLPVGADPSPSPVATAPASQPAPDLQAEGQAQLVAEYGAAHRDEFAGVYFDTEHGGALVARFTAHLEVHQQALDGLVGAPGRVSVQAATYTEQFLLTVVQTVANDRPRLAGQGIVLLTVSPDVVHNDVRVEVKSDDPQARRTLEAYGPPGVVMVVVYPADKPWTQPVGGPGWRLLGVFETKLPYTVAVAADEVSLQSEWTRYGLAGSPPEWDATREVVIFLSDGIGSSCPELRLDDVVMDASARVVYGETSDPYQPRACTADLAGGKTFVVAVERDALPPSPFTLRLGKQPIGCEPDCGFGPSTLQVDLR